MSSIAEHIKVIRDNLDELSDKHATESNEWLKIGEVQTEVAELKQVFLQTKEIEQ